jgi:hypothetical protein
MTAIIFVFLVFNLFGLVVQLSQPVYRWNFDVMLLMLSGVVYNLAILIALLQIKDIKKKIVKE